MSKQRPDPFYIGKEVVQVKNTYIFIKKIICCLETLHAQQGALH